MSRFHDRRYARLALIAALAAALGLTACGRKGPLDPPPSASVAGEQQQTNPMTSPLVAPIGSQPQPGKTNQPVVQAPKQHIFLDGLLN
ncbi:MAG TPA: lipoprotein [Pseudolabrys sp.]|nr:lipoprotein [Pseudolabrys sp.]